MKSQFNSGRHKVALLLGSTALMAITAICLPEVAQAGQVSESASTTQQSEGQQTSSVVTPSGGIEDIVVTAERRSESAQNTPLAITAVSGSALQQRQIVNLEALSNQVPNVEFGRKGGDAFVFIRGLGYDSISPGGETRVAIYNDNIYQPRTQSAFQGFYDVDRVEVLRGPQGTLYGRNATAGAINIITREPDSSLDGYVTARAGNYGLIGTEGAIGGPISDTVSARIAFQTEDHSGYGKNIGTGEDVNDKRTRNVRAKLKFTPSDTFSFRLSADYGREKDHSAGNEYVGAGKPGVTPVGLVLGGAVPTDKQDAAGFGPRFSLETYGVSGEAKLKLGPSTDLVSLTGFRHLLAKTQASTDGISFDGNRQFLEDRSNSFSQELRLAQKVGSIADLLVGGYYFHESTFTGNQIPFTAALFGGPPATLLQAFWTQGRVKTEAYALFGNARIHIAPSLTLTIGGRYSHETKSINEGSQLDLVNTYDPNRAFNPNRGTQTARTTESRFDPKFTLDFKPTNNILLYATYSRGFKSGGFNIGGIQPAFKPEVLEDFEGGMKLDVFDRRLRFNLAAFHYNYTNLQVNIVRGLVLVTENAASAKVDGLELEATARPTPDLHLSLNASYLDARYESFLNVDPAFAALGNQNLAGKRLNYSPKYKINGEIGYTINSSFGKITPRVNVTWVDRIYFSAFNRPQLSQPAWTNVDAFLGYESPDELWSASAYVKNLTDHTYVVSSIVSSGLTGFPIIGQYGAPRTFGVSVTRRF